MKQFDVKGMSCAACSTRVEKAVSKLEGVKECSVSLLTNSMSVEGSADEKDIIEAVEKAGYSASVKGERKADKSDTDNTDKESRVLKWRLISSVIILSVLMYFSMGHMMWSLPVPEFFEGNHIALGILQMLLSAIVMVINQKFFINGFRALLRRSPNMDTLVAMGSGVSFLWSTYALFEMTRAQLEGNTELVHSLLHDFWFESAAMIVTLITVGKMLESRSKGKTTDALKALIKLSPETATLIVDGKETVVEASMVKKGDVFIVRPGESIPVDAVVIEGECSVDESAMTGESIPVDKAENSRVWAGTINKGGFIKCEAQKVGEDTTLSQIIKTVSDAAATKAPIAKIADKVSGVFVPFVLIVAAITVIIWLILGEGVSFALARGISVLVISCPCALGLATPVAITVGNGVGAKNGILFKTAASLEQTGKIETVVLDKTGTVTKGECSVTDVCALNGTKENELLSLAFSLEYKSEHPLAKAVCNYCKEKDISLSDSKNFSVYTGNGVGAIYNGKEAYGGNLKFIESKTEITKEAKQKADSFSEEGKTPLFFSLGDKLSGIIAVSDTLKEESKDAVKELLQMGVEVIMLTGDNEKTAKAIGKQAGIDTVISGVLPDEKEKYVKELCAKGKTAMVGDGINDAPALTTADVGIAIGNGTDVAVDAADIVLMRNKLTDVPGAIRLGRAVLRNIKQNLFWAFFYNALGIPLAAGLFIYVFSWKLNPMFGAAAMSLSSFCVVSNALRLNLLNIYDGKKDKKIKNTNIKKETKEMKKTMIIEGMMCPHCEARVKKTLEALENVEEAFVSHSEDKAVVTLKENICDEELKAIVENEGYKVISIS